MIKSFALQLWTTPQIRPAISIPWWDKGLAILFLGLSVLEGFSRTDLAWQPLALGATSLFTLALLWRRRAPLWAFVIPYGVLQVIELIAKSNGIPWTGLNAAIYILLLWYSLFRWGAGRQCLGGALFFLGGFSVARVIDPVPLPDTLGAIVFLLFPALVGITLRILASHQQQEIEQVKLRERAELARELHDTVAHYVSAIAVQAQAGQVAAQQQPDAPIGALKNIEQAATQTLSELRAMVKTLRQDGFAATDPGKTLVDVDSLLSPLDLSIRKEFAGNLEALPVTIQGALYRVIQESLTNIQRHAVGATNVTIKLTATNEQAELTITNNGRVHNVNSSGFGLIGMAERIQLLEGEFTAGPLTQGGWQVSARIPLVETIDDH